jgi:hypothetical protein
VARRSEADDMVGQLWAGFKDRYGPQMRPEWSMVGDRIASRFTELGTRHDGPRCLTHNDFRPDNMMFGNAADRHMQQVYPLAQAWIRLGTRDKLTP